MLFSSITFILFFLPLTLVVYYLVPDKYKNIMLLISSLIFYAWGEPIYVILLILSTVFNYFCGRDIDDKMVYPPSARLTLVFGIVINIAILCFFKYYGFVIDNINALFQIEIPYRVLSLPVGISFYTFQAISYLVDIYRGKVYAQRNIIKFGVYMAMFPKVIVGPIVRYSRVEKQLNRRTVTWKKIGSGAIYFITGLGKKVILGDSMGAVYEQVAALEMGSMSVLTAWVGCIAFAFEIYFDFSGYSDMARGLGKMFGFEFEQNFHYPYISKNITEFWRRWHISLSSWFRDYVYIPLGGDRKGSVRHIINLLIVWFLTGCWHGSEWNFVIWGLYYGIVVVLENYVYGKRLAEAKPWVQHLVTMVLVLIGWVFFFSPSVGYAFRYIGTMFGIKATAAADAQSLFLISTNWVLFIMCIIGCSARGLNLLNNITNSYKKRSVRKVATCVVYMTIFVVSVAFLVMGNAKPFLYFRF